MEGTSLSVLGLTTLTIDMLVGYPARQDAIVVESLTTGAILGLDFLFNHRAVLDLRKGCLSLEEQNCTLPLDTSMLSYEPATLTPTMVIVERKTHIPPNSEMEILGQVKGIPPAEICLLESAHRYPWLEVARALVRPHERSVPVRVLNTGVDPITLFRGQVLGTLEQADPQEQSIASVQATDREPALSEAKETVLWEMIDQAGTCLDQTQKNQLFSLLTGFSDVFAGSQDDFGRTSRMTHEIATGEAQPIKQPVRRISPSQRQEVRRLLRRMLDQQVIQNSSSPWASPIVLVKKKDGTCRFCVDYRKVNSITSKDAYPLPRVDDILDALAGSKVFSTLDLISGYWQVEVAPQDRPKTAFSTTEGLFEFNVMPFGLCNAPATFQRLMDLVLAGLQWTSCLVYIDDIVVFGRSFEEHLANLSIVLQRLREANLKLQPRKCRQCQEQVSFLGHIVSSKGVSTDPANTDKVKRWPVPTTSKEVQ